MHRRYSLDCYPCLEHLNLENLGSISDLRERKTDKALHGRAEARKIMRRPGCRIWYLFDAAPVEYTIRDVRNDIWCCVLS